MGEQKLSLMGHMDDLRRVFTVTVIAVLVTSTVSFLLFGDQLLHLVTDPLKQYDVQLVYIGITEAFFTKIKLAVLAGILLALPLILWQAWSFIAPALLPKERRYLIMLLPLSLLLFAGGAVFAYLVVFNFAARFLLVVVRGDLQPMLAVGQYVSFLISFVLPFGAVFELPLVIYFLTRLGIVNYTKLTKNRKYVILGIFVLAAVLTPGPDVISQALLAGPLVVLYEAGVLVSRFVKPKAGEQDETPSPSSMS
ncbi:MAG: twin-arginine translocase subunit TatC [Bacillota bacterium]